MPIRLSRSAGSSAAKHINENTAGWTITITSWGLRDENNTENRGGSTATTSWVLPGHHGANAKQHIDKNNTENVSGSAATTCPGSYRLRSTLRTLGSSRWRPCST